MTPVLTTVSAPAPPAMPLVMASARVPPSQIGFPANATPEVLNPIPADTARASEVVFRWPAFEIEAFRVSLASMPEALDKAVAATIAPATPAVTATLAPTDAVLALALALIVPPFSMVSIPEPAAIPAAFASAVVPPAQKLSAPTATPFATTLTEAALANAAASAVNFPVRDGLLPI